MALETATEAEWEDLTCPILSTIMLDPVVAADGHTYERAAIEEWIDSCQDVDVTSPMTGAPLQSRIVFANHTVRRSIMSLLERRPDLKAMVTSPEEVKHLVAMKRNPPPPRPDSPPLIDLRTEEEIAAANAAAAIAKAEPLPAPNVQQQPPPPRPPPQQMKQEQAEDEPKLVRAVSSFSLAAPSSLLLAQRPTHHSVGDVLRVFRSGANGAYEPTSEMKLDPHDSSERCTVLRLPSARQGKAVDSEYIVSGCSNGRVFMVEYDRAYQTLLKMELRGGIENAHRDAVTTISSWPFSARDNTGGAVEAVPLVVTGSRDKTLRVWKADTPLASSNRQWSFSMQAELAEHTDFVLCSDVEVSSGQLLSGGEDWKAVLWDLHRPDAGPISTYELHSYGVRCCAWSSSGQHALSPFDAAALARGAPSAPVSPVFVTGGDDETAFVLDPRAKDGGRLARLSVGAAVLACCWGPTDDMPGELPWLALAGGVPLSSFNANSDNVQGWIRVFDPRMWKSVGDCRSHGVTPLSELQGGGSGGFAAGKAPSLASDTAEGDSNKARMAHRNMVSTITPLRVADGSVALASCGGDEYVRLWKLPRGPGGLQTPRLLRNLRIHDSSNSSLALL